MRRFGVVLELVGPRHTLWGSHAHCQRMIVRSAPRKLHVAKSDSLSEAFGGIAGGYEFLGYVALISDLDESAHHRRIMNFLVLVQLAAARHSGRVDVPDEVAVLADAADHVALHHAHVID